MHLRASHFILFLFVMWTAAAHAHNNPVVEACVHDLEIPDAERVETPSDVVAAVRAKIAARVSRLNDGVLVSDQQQDDGKMEVSISEGITRLFLREVTVGLSRETIGRMASIGKAWANARKVVIESEQAASQKLRVFDSTKPSTPVPRNAEGIFETPFIVRYLNEMKVMLQGMPPSERETLVSPRGRVLDQEKRLKSFLMEDVNANLAKTMNPKSLLFQHMENLNQAVKIAMDGAPGKRGIRDRYYRGESNNPDFAELESILQAQMDAVVVDLRERYPLTEEPPESAKAPRTAPHARDYVQLKDGKISFTFDDAIATYENEIAALVLTSPQKEKQRKRNMNLILLHGAGTNKSNVASWLPLFPRIIQAGFDPYAINAPGSTGTNGIGLNSIRLSPEMDAYLKLDYEFVGKTAQDTSLPMIAMGRSMGATSVAMNMLYGPRNGQPLPVDMVFMMSFSNPFTLDLQVQNLMVQLQQGSIAGIVKSALDHSDILAADLQKNLRVVQPHELSLIEQRAQDQGVFAQGAADEDGILPGSAPGSIIAELKEYRDRFFPFAHVYDFEAPQLKYGDAWFDEYGIPPNDSEGTHFLVSAMNNMTDKKRPASIPMTVPEKDLPKLEDQQLEVFALAYAMLDYQIDLSPLTDPVRRESLRKKREGAMGGDRPFAYLNWFVNNVVNSRQKQQKGSQEPSLTLDQIIADPNVALGRDGGIYGRIKRVHAFALAEKKRVEALLKQ